MSKKYEKPTKNNPFSNLIDAYVNDYSLGVTNKFNTTYMKQENPAQYAENALVLTQMKEILYTNRNSRTIPLWGVAKLYMNNLGYGSTVTFQELKNELDKLTVTTTSAYSVASEERTSMDLSYLGNDILPADGIPDYGSQQYNADDKNDVLKHLNEVKFTSMQHQTAKGYYIGFLPSGGHAIYIPSHYYLNMEYSLQLDRDSNYRMRYVAISQRIETNMPNLPYVNESFGKSIYDMFWWFYPILPHLAYVEYNDRWWTDYLWIRDYKFPFSLSKEKTIGSTFDWRYYFKHRRDRKTKMSQYYAP